MAQSTDTVEPVIAGWCCLSSVFVCDLGYYRMLTLEGLCLNIKVFLFI